MADGNIMINVENIASPHVLRIVQQASSDTSYRNIHSDAEIELKFLKGGPIQLDLLANSIVVASTNVLISEPEPLSGGKIKIEKSPSAGSTCDGALSVSPSGGNPPYTYKWSSNAGSIEEAFVADICRGIYRCEINDSKNCGPIYVSIPLVKNAQNNNSE